LDFWKFLTYYNYSDIIHPDQPGISKASLQEKLASLYKATPEQVSVFGLRTIFGGGKTTAFACIYDSVEARKKFDAKHRLVRNGLATKPERASRQQSMWPLYPYLLWAGFSLLSEQILSDQTFANRKAAQEPHEDTARYREDKGQEGEEGIVRVFTISWVITVGDRERD
jgi:ribosomal protein S24E